MAGEADCLYSIRAPSGAPAPPSVCASGYRQTVRPLPDGWEISVSVRPIPTTTTVPCRADWAHPALVALPREFIEELRTALPASAGPAEISLSLARFLRARFVYEGRPGEPDDPVAACRSGRASCVGLARLASALLEAHGFTCVPVIGLRAPTDGAPLSLEGGALHVWLSLDPPAGQTFFFDPAFSSGWVPERYIVLRVGAGWEPGDLAKYRGGSLETLWRRDRLFYFPAGVGETLVWSAGTPAGAALAGKALDGTDAPLSGMAYVRGPQGVLAVPLWQGNFCFNDLPPGDYELVLESGGARVGGESLTLGPMDKKTLVIYSRGERGRGAAHGTGRQPGGPFPP